MHPLLERLGLTSPIVQAPMAGTSTPELAAAVSNAGALGSIAIGHIDGETAAADIARLRETASERDTAILDALGAYAGMIMPAET